MEWIKCQRLVELLDALCAFSTPMVGSSGYASTNWWVSVDSNKLQSCVSAGIHKHVLSVRLDRWHTILTSLCLECVIIMSKNLVGKDICKVQCDTWMDDKRQFVKIYLRHFVDDFIISQLSESLSCWWSPLLGWWWNLRNQWPGHYRYESFRCYQSYTEWWI